MIREYHYMDCMKGMPEYPDNHFDWAIVDPQYGIKESAYRANSRGKLTTTTDYPDIIWDLEPPGPEYFKELFRVSKQQIIWGINYFDVQVGSGRIFWDKVNGDVNFSDGELAYCSAHHSTRMFRFMWAGMRQGVGGNGARMQGNKKLNEKRIHPTQKPVQLYKWICRNYLKPGQIILDTHVGSGSSLIAYEEYGCLYVGYENALAHYKDSTDRIKEFRRNPKLALV